MREIDVKEGERFKENDLLVEIYLSDYSVRNLGKNFEK